MFVTYLGLLDTMQSYAEPLTSQPQLAEMIYSKCDEALRRTWSEDPQKPIKAVSQSRT